MKISIKIFAFTYCLIMLLTVVGGFVLVNYLYTDQLAQVKTSVKQSNEMVYTYLASMNDLSDELYTQYSMNNIQQRMSDSDNSIEVEKFWDYQEELQDRTSGYLGDGDVLEEIVSQKGVRYYQVVSRCNDYVVIVKHEIETLFNSRDDNFSLYRKVIIAVSVIIAVVLYFFSMFMTRPISRVTKMANELSEGNYSARVDTRRSKMRSYEVKKLGTTLNQMAENTEQHIEELKDIAQKREDFVGDFTHEIKTPLTSIIGYADLMRTYELEPEKRREYCNFIFREGKRLEQLSFRLLDMLVIGKNEFPLKKVSMKSYLERCKDSLRFVEEKYNMKVSLFADDAEAYIESALLQTAIVNLCDNACKASEEGSEIIVRGTKEEKNYVITVEDKGCGIPEDQLSKILEPFYMVDKSRARSKGGAGLGLALCKRIAEVHGGDILVSSVLGEGTKISILVCYEDVESEAEDESREESQEESQAE